ESQRVLERLETRQKSVRLDHDARTRRRGTGLLKVAHELLQIDRAAGVETADANIRIDHQHGIDMRRQALQQSAYRPRLAPVAAVVEASPPCLPQTHHRVVA